MQIDIRPTPANALGNLKAVGDIKKINLSWTLPIGDSTYSAAQIWTNTINDRETGTLVDTVGGNTYSMTVPDTGTHYFWIRAVNSYNRTDAPFTGPASAAARLIGNSDIGVGALDLASAQVVGKLAAGNVTGLGALAILDQVGVSKITGLGSLATQNNVSAYQVTNLGDLAYANSIAANNIGAGTLAAGVVYAGTITADQIKTGSLSADRINGGSGNFRVLSGGVVTMFGAELVRCSADNSGLPTAAAFTATGDSSSYGTGPAIQANAGYGYAIQMTGAIKQSGSSINYLAAIYALSDNTYTLGGPSNRWNSLYVASGVINTSDARTKKDVKQSDLGLDFINALNPVSYRQVVAENVPDDKKPASVEVGPPAPVIETTTPRAGRRRHYGLIAQEVQQAMKSNGVDDAAFWILTDPKDADSQQGLRYEELMAPMIKAIQELSNTVKLQQVQIEDLKARLPA